MAGEESEGASRKEQLIEACRRNNTDLLGEIIESCATDAEISSLLNDTTTVLGNHLYHEAALAGNYEIIDTLLDQPNFECDPLTLREGDTPLHSAIRWINSEPPAQRPFGSALVEMMLEAGSSPRVRNKGGLTPDQLVDPANPSLAELIRRHAYASLNAGDFVNADRRGSEAGPQGGDGAPPGGNGYAGDESDGDAEFSGSDDEERAEWERRRREGKKAEKG